MNPIREKTNRNNLNSFRKDHLCDLTPEGKKPQDTVQIVKFKKRIPPIYTNSSFQFFTADWSGLLCLYDEVNTNSKSPGSRLICRSWYKFNSPIFSACWGRKNKGIYVGCASGSIYWFSTAEINSYIEDNQHVNVKCLVDGIKDFSGFEHYFNQSTNYNMLAVYSFSSPSIRFFNVENCSFFEKTLELEAPVTCSASNSRGDFSVFGLSNQTIFAVTNLNSFSIDYQTGELSFNLNPSSKIFQSEIGAITCVSVNELLTKIGIGSVKGRITVVDVKMDKFLTLGKNSFNGWSTLCKHTRKNPITKEFDAFQVNHIMFHKRHPNLVLSSGSEGITYFINLKKLMMSELVAFEFQHGIPVTSFDIDEDFTQIVYGLGYDWSKGASGLDSVGYKAGVFLKKFENNILSYNFN